MPSKAQRPYLTRGESELMALLWKHGPSTVGELMEKLERPVANTTVATMVRILEQKAYVKHDIDTANAKAHRFRAAVQEKQIKKRHLRDLVDRLFSGNAEHLMTSLLDDEELSREELRRLRDEIDSRLKEKP